MDEEIIKSDNSSTHLTTLPQPIRPIDQKSQENNIKIEIKIYVTEKRKCLNGAKGIQEKKNNIHIKKIIYINREQNIYIKQKVSQIKKKNKI